MAASDGSRIFEWGPFVRNHPALKVKLGCYDAKLPNQLSGSFLLHTQLWINIAFPSVIEHHPLVVKDLRNSITYIDSLPQKYPVDICKLTLIIIISFTFVVYIK